MAHSRGPINDRAAGLLEAAEICQKYFDRHAIYSGGGERMDGYDLADAIRAATVEQATRAEGREDVKPMKYPCDCKLPPNYEGCACGNSDDSNSQGFAIGWNACLEAIRGTKERV